MAREISAGILPFRQRGKLEVLLAHPGGPYWARKDAGVWTIAKGLINPGEELLTAALREFTEETGFEARAPFLALAPVKQKSGKVVHAWAFEADFALDHFASNSFELEWPPRSGKREMFPEVDRIGYFDQAVALEKIIAYQRPFLAQLFERLRREETAPVAAVGLKP